MKNGDRVSFIGGLHVGQGIVFVLFMHGNLLLGSEWKWYSDIENYIHYIKFDTTIYSIRQLVLGLVYPMLMCVCTCILELPSY